MNWSRKIWAHAAPATQKQRGTAASKRAPAVPRESTCCTCDAKVAPGAPNAATTTWLYSNIFHITVGETEGIWEPRCVHVLRMSCAAVFSTSLCVRWVGWDEENTTERRRRRRRRQRDAELKRKTLHSAVGKRMRLGLSLESPFAPTEIGCAKASFHQMLNSGVSCVEECPLILRGWMFWWGALATRLPSCGSGWLARYPHFVPKFETYCWSTYVKAVMDLFYCFNSFLRIFQNMSNIMKFGKTIHISAKKGTVDEFPHYTWRRIRILEKQPQPCRHRCGEKTVAVLGLYWSQVAKAPMTGRNSPNHERTATTRPHEATPKRRRRVSPDLETPGRLDTPALHKILPSLFSNLASLLCMVKPVESWFSIGFSCFK